MDLLHICFYAKMAENCQPSEVGGESKRVKCVTVTQSSLTAPLERYMRAVWNILPTFTLTTCLVSLHFFVPF